MRTTTFRFVGLSLLLVLSSSPKIANANGLKIHRPSAGEVILCEVPSRNILCGNSGHYAQATGGAPPYAWTCIPAQAIVFDASIDPILKRTIRIMAQANQACSPAIQLRVTDTAGNNNTVLINAVQLAWKVPEGPDRVVGVQRDGEDPKRTRRLYFTATGQGIQSSRLRVRGFHTGSPLPASGTIEVDAYRNSAAAITPLGPPNCQQGFGEWLVGVGVSGGCPVIQNEQGDHWFDIHGVETSAHVDDIEVDMLVEIQPPLLDNHPAPAATLRCFDGIGAHVLYTSVKMDFDLVVEEPEEAGKGARAYRAYEGSADGTQDDDPVGVVQKAYPSDLGVAGYSLRVESLMGGSEPTYDVYSPETKTVSSVTSLSPFSLPTERGPSIDLVINEGLEFTYTLRPEARSSKTNDSHARVTLIHDGAEMGGGSCRDFIVTTSVAIEVTSPTPSPYDDTGGVDTNGNRWKFNDGTPGKLDIYARAIATPSSEYVDAELVDRVEFVFAPHAPITGSTLSWSHPSESDAGYATHRSWPDSDAGCWEAKATLTGLPDHNADFGTKQLRLMLRRVDNGNRYHVGDPHGLQVYYTGTAKNHPGGGTPNWFYYYKDQDVALGFSGYDYYYRDEDTSYTLQSPSPVTWIGNKSGYSSNEYATLAKDSSGLWRFVDWSPEYKYWPAFCGTLKHEAFHRDMGAIGVGTPDDHDGDGMPDTFETDNAMDPERWYWIKFNEPPTPTENKSLGDLMREWGDQEMWAGGNIERDGKDAADITLDWAYPGSQWADGE